MGGLSVVQKPGQSQTDKSDKDSKNIPSSNSNFETVGGVLGSCVLVGNMGVVVGGLDSGAVNTGPYCVADNEYIPGRWGMAGK